MVSGFTPLISTTSTINNTFNEYYTTTQTSTLLSLKSNQSDMASGFSSLISTTTKANNDMLTINTNLVSSSSSLNNNLILLFVAWLIL